MVVFETSKKEEKTFPRLFESAQKFSAMIRHPNENDSSIPSSGVESLVHHARHAEDFSFLNEKEIRDSHRLSIIHPRAFTMQTRDGVRGWKLNKRALFPRNDIDATLYKETLHHHRRVDRPPPPPPPVIAKRQKNPLFSQ